MCTAEPLKLVRMILLLIILEDMSSATDVAGILSNNVERLTLTAELDEPQVNTDYCTQIPQKAQNFTDLLEIPMHFNLSPFYSINTRTLRHGRIRFLRMLFRR